MSIKGCILFEVCAGLKMMTMVIAVSFAHEGQWGDGCPWRHDF